MCERNLKSKIEELFKLKIAALLHDPPNKPWLLLCRKDHEAEALDYVKKLAGLDTIPDEVRKADWLASSIDRYVLSMLMGERYIPGFMPCEKLVLKNAVNPFFQVELPSKLREELVSSFKTKLACSVGQCKDLKLRYLLLYALYEMLWIDHCLPVGPADTRVPIHTVFDHAYATAAALNWIHEDGVGGLLVGLDVAGVERFIASSRKLRDAWVSSYLVSALVWYSILPFIDALGPDVVVTPSLRLNPFYLHWLSKKVERAEADCGTAREALKKLEEYIYLGDEFLMGLYRRFDIPPYACVPERATLILPRKEILGGTLDNDVTLFIEERFRNGWSALWEGIRRYARAMAESENDLLWRFVESVFSYYDRAFGEAACFHRVPPLMPRTEFVEIKKDKVDWRVYDEAYRQLAAKLALRKHRRVEPEVELNLARLTEEAFARGLGFPRKSSRGFEYCTSCGKLPALLVLPSGEGARPEEEEYGFYVYGAVEKGWSGETIEEKWRALRGSIAAGQRTEEVEDFERWLATNTAKLQGLKTVFTPGERLCPWCFAKRVLSLEPRLFNILLLGYDEYDALRYASELAQRRASFGFPSTPDVASLRMREELVARVEKGTLSVQSLAQLLTSYQPLQQMLDILRAAVEAARPWRVEAELDERIVQMRLGNYEEIVLRGLLKADPETLWFSSDKQIRSTWASILRQLNLASLLWSYYGLVMADGDSIGDLLLGKTSALLGLPERGNEEKLYKLTYELLKARGVCDFEKLIATLLEEVEEKWKTALDYWTISLSNQLSVETCEVRRRLEEARSYLLDALKQRMIPVSISYHFSVSGALLRIALLDAVVISKLGGFVVYSGGDDLMSLVPVDVAAKLVYVSRRLFAGAPLSGCYADLLRAGKTVELTADGGFIKVNEAWLPALPGVGRSYCVMLAHYHYPLSLAIERARATLEEAKRDVRTYCEDQQELKKDVAAFVYCPRGGLEFTFVPQTVSRSIHIAEKVLTPDAYLDEVAEPMRAVHGLLQAVRPPQGRPYYSVSILYDVENVNQHLVKAVEECYRDTIISLIDLVLKKNITSSARRKEVRWNELSELIAKLDESGRGGRRFSFCYVSTDRFGTHLFTTIVRAVRYLRGGMR